jgi:GntR family transcriptional repressor for pyruvate dehydrogenase complex
MDPVSSDLLVISAIPREDRLSDRVAQQLQRLIVDGRFKLGERIPSERELAEQFSVSRTVIREAVRSLVTKGFLEVRAGSGTVVRMPTTKLAVESMRFLLRGAGPEFDSEKVTEVRRMLEVEIAGLAAERRTAHDIEALEAILRSTAEHLNDPEAFVKDDVAFHAALARATGNELFSVLLDSIVDILVTVRLLALRVPGALARGLGFHRRIFERVRDADVAGAREIMNSHMDEARQTMKQALSAMRGGTTG